MFMFCYYFRLMNNKLSGRQLEFDTLIIGSGLAGLTLALNLSQHKKVGLITKRALLDGASGWAQGGIAATLSEEDSPAALVPARTAGAFLLGDQPTMFISKPIADISTPVAAAI